MKKKGKIIYNFSGDILSIFVGYSKKEILDVLDLKDDEDVRIEDTSVFVKEK